MGKYDELLEELPKSFGEDPARQDKINVIKNAIKDGLTARCRTCSQEWLCEDTAEAETCPSCGMSDVDILKNADILAPNELVRRYGDVRAIIDEQNELLSKLSLERSAYEQLMAEKFGESDMKRIVLDNLRAVTIGYEPRPKVIDQEAFRLWCIKNGYEKKMHLHSSVATSLVKDMLMRGEEEPDGIVAEGVLKVRYSTKGA